MDKEIEVEKNFVVMVHCSNHHWDDTHQTWDMQYGPYTEEVAQQIHAELLALHSPMRGARVTGFSIEKLETKTVAEIMAEVKKTNVEGL